VTQRYCSTQLRRRTDGTRWTNQQLLWHMAFGYLVVSRLVRLFGRLPHPFSRAFAALLDAGTRPFHQVNYLGGVGGALVFHGPRLTRLLDRTIDRLHRRWTPSPTRRSPDGCTSRSAGTRHYDFHRAQLTLG
jgi:hypothetical protein